MSRNDRILVYLLRFVGGWLLLAWVAVPLPEEWMIPMHQSLALGEWPGGPLILYLARSISILYGFIGLMSLYVSWDVDRYRPLIRFGCLIGLPLAPIMLFIGVSSAMPMAWAIVEAVCILLFSVLILLVSNKSTPGNG